MGFAVGTRDPDGRNDIWEVIIRGRVRNPDPERAVPPGEPGVAPVFGIPVGHTARIEDGSGSGREEEEEVALGAGVPGDEAVPAEAVEEHQHPGPIRGFVRYREPVP